MWKILLLPRPGYYVTPISVGANLIVFLAMALASHRFLSFSSADLIAWGGNYGPLLKQGQWFRLITAMFIHGGITHLLMNLYGLLFVGPLLENGLGATRFAIVYLVTGTAASVTSFLLHPATVSVGASGAIFGLYGVLLVLMVIKNFGRAEAFVPIMSFLIFLGLNLLIGAGKVGIDNAAHLGGLITGLILGGIIAALGRARKRVHG